MSPAELSWRTRQAISQRWQSASRRNVRVPQASFIWPVSQGEYPVRIDGSRESYESTRIFDLEFAPDFRFDWHHDYRTGRTVPVIPSRKIEIRDSGVVGDIKYIWEINRHQHLSAMAFSSHPQAIGIVVGALKDWLEANPYMEGVNWTSSLELGLRLISWSLLLPAIAPELQNDLLFRDSFAKAVYLHLKSIRGHLSRYSSANNHLIGELAGLYVGATCFPWWPQCGEWRSFAKRELESQIQAQFTSEGVNREQATSYQLFTLELLLVAALVGRNRSDEFSAAFWSRIQAALQFVAVLATPSGELPSIGDSDDARGFLLSHRESSVETLMRLAQVPGQEGPSAAVIALAPQGASAPSHDDVEVSTTRLMPDGGLLIHSEPDWKLVMDVGPLGYTSIAAHGHADALSLLVAIQDRYVLTDAGTYAYHSHPEWRTYFRGTAAHNTARVDGFDQSEMIGRFLWGRKANVTIEEFTDSDGELTILARHDGYQRLADPVIHKRMVHLRKTARQVTVEDTFVCEHEHKIELHWHFAPEADVVACPEGGVQVSLNEARIKLRWEELGAKVEVVKGSNSPILGWYSPSFNVKVPASTIRMTEQIHGTTTLRTILEIAT